MSETPDITNLFRSKHDCWDPDSELGSIIYLARDPITKIPTKAIVIASNEVMKSRENNWIRCSYLLDSVLVPF